MIFKNSNKSDLFKSVVTAYVILLLHVVLLAGIGVTIILFKGLYQYLPWVMGGLAVLVIGISLLIYYRMKNSASDIKDILSMPQFRDSTVEVNLLGGMASFKIPPETDYQPRLGYNDSNSSEMLMLENDINKTEQKILRLTGLFKKGIITKEEFDKAKQDVLQG